MQNEASQTTNAKEKEFGTIKGRGGFIVHVVMPNLLALLIIIIGGLLGGYLTIWHIWNILIGAYIALVFGLLFFLMLADWDGTKYENKKIVPLWYGLAVWILFASIPVYLIFEIVWEGDFWIDLTLLALSLVLSIFRHPLKGTRKLTFIIETYFHDAYEIFQFYRDIIHSLIRGIFWCCGCMFWFLLLLIYKNRHQQPQVTNDQYSGELTPNEQNNSDEICILHLSDFHLRQDTSPSLEKGTIANVEVRNKLIKSLKQLKNGPNKVDYIVITGDITDTGSDEDFSKATEFLREIKNLYSDIPLYLVPGNHDLSVNSCFWPIDNAATPFIREATLLLGSFSLPVNNLFDERLSRFNELCRSVGIRATSSPKHCNVHIDGKLSVVVFNTSSPSVSIGSNAAGLFRREDVAALKTFQYSLKDSRLLILCHHHIESPEIDDVFIRKLTPLELAGMRASGALNLTNLLANDLKRNAINTLILHGHTHIERSYKTTNSSGEIKIPFPVRSCPSTLDNNCPAYMIHTWKGDGSVNSVRVNFFESNKRDAEEGEVHPVT